MQFFEVKGKFFKDIENAKKEMKRQVEAGEYTQKLEEFFFKLIDDMSIETTTHIYKKFPREVSTSDGKYDVTTSKDEMELYIDHPLNDYPQYITMSVRRFED